MTRYLYLPASDGSTCSPWLACAFRVRNWSVTSVVGVGSWRVIHPGRPAEPLPGHGKWRRSFRAALPRTPRSWLSAPAKASAACEAVLETLLRRDGLWGAAGSEAGRNVAGTTEAL